MKPRMWFGLGMWLGIVLGGFVAIYGANQRWEMEAYNHGCAKYKTNLKYSYPHLQWGWFDEDDEDLIGHEHKAVSP